MSLIETIWESLANTYAMPNSRALTSTTSTASDTMSRQQDQNIFASQQREQQDSPQQIFQKQQLLQHPHHSSPWTQHQQDQDSACDLSSLYAAQNSLQCVGPNVASYSDKLGGRVTPLSDQWDIYIFPSSAMAHVYRYDFSQLAACPSPKVSTPDYMTPSLGRRDDHAFSVEQPHERASVWSQDPNAYTYWQQQQPQQPPCFFSPPPLSPAEIQPVELKHAQVQYAEPHNGIIRTWEQLCSAYTQQTSRASNSYLSATGVPFDLHSRYVPLNQLTTPLGNGSLSEVEGCTVGTTCSAGNSRLAIRADEQTVANVVRSGLKPLRPVPRGSDLARPRELPTKLVGQSAKNSIDTVQARRPTPSPSPPSERVKGAVVTSPTPVVSSMRARYEAPATSARLISNWGSFAAHIAQDDKNMAVKARDVLKKIGGGTHRPEIRENYRNRKGQELITIHERSGGIALPMVTEPQDCGNSFKAKKTLSDATIMVGDPYDASLPEGGVALSLSDF